ALAGDHFFRF
uniref:FMRFamide-like neuropeptide ALAGDHFFRF-amide n=1 Tax=Mytilus edulis TaxID=6550 RepID=FARP_MYTED|nr:RecName: Full=FMRFamide-like neuropeptide ALAGDHFFRF-amide [Mytilus edulis]prf//1909171A FMRFamide-related peptide [Mytilus edulis]